MGCRGTVRPAKGSGYPCQIFSLFLLSFTFFFSLTTVESAEMPYYERLAPVAELSSPTAVAHDGRERLYVAETNYNRVNIYSAGGQYISRIGGLGRPISVAVDSVGRIYVGNKDRGNVEVYGPGLSYSHELGAGAGEFGQPGAIAVDDSGIVYVADSRRDEIRAYNPSGGFLFSFGSPGEGDGEFHYPTSIAIDVAAGELIISDRQLTIEPSIYGDSKGEGARVQVFDMAGGFIRSFGEFGIGEGKIFKPMGVAVDEERRIYVSDSYQKVVQVFDSVGVYLGTIYDLDNPMRTPLGISMSGSGRLYIAALGNGRVEVYGIGDYTQMQVSPRELVFHGQEAGAAPGPQIVEIANTGRGILNWNVSADAGWLTAAPSAGSTAPAESSLISAGAELSGLTAGSYSGVLYISTETGMTEEVAVALEVSPRPPELFVEPLLLEFVSLNGSLPPSQGLAISNTGGGSLSWQASTGQGWIGLSGTEGPAPGSVEVSADITSMAEGSHTGGITVTAEGASGSPVEVTVNLHIIIQKGAIEVTSNIEGAHFTISGAQDYEGSGKSWVIHDVPVGTYAIIYGEVEGYSSPAPEAQELQADGVIHFHGQYEEQWRPAVKRHIITGAGEGRFNPSLVRVFDAEGAAEGSGFIAYPYRIIRNSYGVNVASGDIDGDGIFEIITGPGPGNRDAAEVKVFDGSGSELEGLAVTAFDLDYGANVASADLDGDHRYEVIAAAGAGYRNPALVKVYAYSPSGGVLTESGIEFTAYEGGYGARVTAGDTDCDGRAEIITVPGAAEDNMAAVRIWKVDTEAGPGLWGVSLLGQFTVPGRYGFSASIASADTNGDGCDEVVVAEGPHRRAGDTIRVYDGYGGLALEFSSGMPSGYGATVAAGDMDGDGVAEIVVGAGPDRGSPALVKVFSGSGIEKAGFIAHSLPYGANVAVGDLGYRDLGYGDLGGSSGRPGRWSR